MAQLKQVMKGPNEIVSFDHPAIHYPQLASTKFDGFRMLNLCGERLLSPNMKDIRNRHLPLYLENFLAYCAKHRIVTDGELWSPERSFHMPVKEEGISSILTTHDRQIPTDIGYYIFDMMSESEWDNETEKPFLNRYLDYRILAGLPRIHCVEQWHITSPSEALTFFNGQLESGNEGMILRQPTARYKHGRTTLKQDGMWKFKEFVTHDAIIVGVEEQMKLKDGVERTRNELGHLERRFEADLYEPAGMVGAFEVEKDNQRFKVKPGRGMDNNWKRQAWLSREQFIGHHCEYKMMPHGTLNAPRIGSLVRMRPDLD
jgi:DNA ligase-1